MNWSVAAAVTLALGVILGAFGAHALRGRLDDYLMSVYQTAVLYHFIQAMGALIVSLMPRVGAISESKSGWVCGLLLGGVVIFSGSLYALALTGYRGLGAITPIGGLSFIAGWAMLAWFLIRK